MMNTIPAGYKLTSISYENDGDNYKTVIREGVSENEIRLMAKLAKLILNCETGLENQYQPNERLKNNAYKKLFPLFDEYKIIFTEDEFARFKEDVGEMVYYINQNILGSAAIDGMWMRVLDSFKIEYLPEDVKIEDVTNNF